jgi:ribosomal protein S18 acetylase RimI-like enzyme
VKVTLFEPTDNLIVVHATIWGPRGHKGLRLALDTAATHTHIVPEFLDEIGYGPQFGDRITSITSAIGDEPGYMMPVTRFSVLGFTLTNFRIHVHDLPETLGIQGLLGLSFLRQFNYEIRSADGRILASRCGAVRDGRTLRRCDDEEAIQAIELHTGDRAELMDLFRLADDSPHAIAMYRDLGDVLVARDDARVIVGHVQMIGAELKSLAVVEAWRGVGLGQALAREGIAHARERVNEGSSCLPHRQIRGSCASTSSSASA